MAEGSITSQEYMDKLEHFVRVRTAQVEQSNYQYALRQFFDAAAANYKHSALTEEQGSFFVYLQLDEEGYKKQLVTLGADNGESVQILSGVKAGDRVVTEGAYQVKLASATNAIPAHSHEH